MHKFIFGLITATCLTFVGCGGDGGNSSVVTPPPGGGTGGGGTSNTPPTVTLSADKSSLDEGQPFTLDASGSSDSDGDTLTYTWVQTAGTNIDLSNVSGNMITLNAAEVSQTETATFEVQVSDGTDTRTASVDIEFLNIVQTPESVFEDFLDNPLVDELQTDKAVYRATYWFLANSETERVRVGLFGVSDDINSPLNYVAVSQGEVSGEALRATASDPFKGGSFPSEGGVFPVSDTVFPGENDTLHLFSPEQDKIIEFISANDHNIPWNERDIENPVDYEIIPDGTGQGYQVKVFQTGNQATIFDYDDLGQPTLFPELLSLKNPTLVEDFSRSTETRDAAIRETYPDVEIIENRSLDALVGIAAVTDSQHQGAHRVIKFTENQNGVEIEELAVWEKGAPTDIAMINDHLVFAIPSTPYLRAYPVVKDDNNEITNIGSPIFLDVGFGVEAVYNNLLMPGSCILNYRKTNTLRFYLQQL